jgi:hypothetical protein
MSYPARISIGGSLSSKLHWINLSAFNALTATLVPHNRLLPLGIDATCRRYSWVFRLHVDLDLHSELVASIPVINARQWNCLIGSSRHSNSDKITIAYDAVGGIKFDPPGECPPNTQLRKGRHISQSTFSRPPPKVTRPIMNWLPRRGIKSKLSLRRSLEEQPVTRGRSCSKWLSCLRCAWRKATRRQRNLRRSLWRSERMARQHCRPSPTNYNVRGIPTARAVGAAQVPRSAFAPASTNSKASYQHADRPERDRIRRNVGPKGTALGKVGRMRHLGRKRTRQSERGLEQSSPAATTWVRLPQFSSLTRNVLRVSLFGSGGKHRDAVFKARGRARAHRGDAGGV